MWVNRYAGEYNERANVRSTIIWSCFLMGFAYVAFNAFFANNDVNIALDAIIFVLSLYVVLKYSVKSTLAIFSGEADSGSFLIVGVFLSWLTQSGRAAGSVVSRLSAFDPMWLNSEFFGWVKIFTIFAAICHVVAAGAIQRDGRESVPAPSRYGLGVTLIVAFSLAAALVTYKPNLRPAIESLPKWTIDTFRTGSLFVPGRSSSLGPLEPGVSRYETTSVPYPLFTLLH
jgi:hypothetical protein